MRQFATGGFRIWNLGREAKLVYTGFGLFALLAIGASFLLYEDLVGGRHSVRGYYAGQPASAAVASPPPPPPPQMDRAPGHGPALELPDEPARSTLEVAIPYRKLLEVTHFHLFTVPVFLLIVAHLFMLTGLSAGAKAAWIVSAWLSTLLHLLAPWLIRYASSAWSVLYPISGAAMALSMTTLTVYPIVVMWAGPRGEEPTRAAAARETE